MIKTKQTSKSLKNKKDYAKTHICYECKDQFQCIPITAIICVWTGKPITSDQCQCTWVGGKPIHGKINRHYYCEKCSKELAIPS